ncbi:ROK family protein [Flavihumibacter sp. ZG627]|uniref:ROK family protein n=1 Tax=Flavihumibacter sp. ZG627 TaxID=1463156 RepID=UPI00057D33C9|nr:ROK family protein [Flavihumibacter sp. ZG627]KIC90602.1 ROK family transcriptional regulator [Flavihumibacter sp. ZG627]
MASTQHIGIDLGGTNVRVGLVDGPQLLDLYTESTKAGGSQQEVIEQLFSVTDRFYNDQIQSIGIGVPGLVDVSQGMVFDVVNIPSLQEIPLQALMEDRYRIPVRINNDANCFALGEYHFGTGKRQGSMVGLSIGTGLGAGIIINGKLHSGKHCGAGEFGMIDYLEHNIEYYASGQFFQHVYDIDGLTVFKLAVEGDDSALEMYRVFGKHLGNAIKTILYTLDTDKIVLGGSVSEAWPYFKNSMWEQIKTFAYKKTILELKVDISALSNSALLGAAALYIHDNL